MTKSPTYVRSYRLLPNLRLEAVRYDHDYPKPTLRPRRTVRQWHLIWDRRPA